MRGTVEQGSISLRLRGVLAHRPYQPVFTGLIDTAATPMRLRGRIRTPVLVKVFVWWWTGFSILWTVGAAVVTQLQGDLWWMPLVGVLMVTVGFVFFATVNRFVNGLASRLKDILGEAAAESPNKSFERTREG
jgi:hypothetical protein